MDAALREVDDEFQLTPQARLALLAFVDDFLCSTVQRAAQVAWAKKAVEVDVAVGTSPPNEVEVTAADVREALQLSWGL